MISKILFDAFVLLMVYNPVEVAIVLLSIKNPGDKTAVIALKSVLVVFVLSFLIIFASSFFFSHLHSSFLQGDENLYISVVKIIGGIILFWVGWMMIQGKRASKLVLNKKEKKEAVIKEDISIIPLAVPVILGPGVFTTLIVLGERARSVIQKEELFIALVISLLIVYLSLRYSEKLIAFLGLHGIRIVSIITGLFIMFISVVFFIDGIKGAVDYILKFTSPISGG
jgi:multiple antibiotic resistance protein